MEEIIRPSVENAALPELLRMLADSEEDVRAGRVAPVEESFAEIRERLLAE